MCVPRMQITVPTGHNLIWYCVVLQWVLGMFRSFKSCARDGIALCRQLADIVGHSPDPCLM